MVQYYIDFCEFTDVTICNMHVPVVRLKHARMKSHRCNPHNWVIAAAITAHIAYKKQRAAFVSVTAAVN